MAPQGGGAKQGGALPKLRILCPKTAFFWPKNGAETQSKRPNEGKRFLHSTCASIPHIPPGHPQGLLGITPKLQFFNQPMPA